MRRRARYLGAMAAWIFASGAGAQNYTNISYVLDGAGRWSAGGALSNITAVAQPGGVGVSSGGAVWNQAGFLNTFVLRPFLDTDGDGLADEVDPDNDSDTLLDGAELAGTSFSPTTATDPNDADTDDDGAPDDAEAAAGTDPTDDTAFLHLVSIRSVPSGMELGWVARSNKVYRVMGERDLTASPAFSNRIDEVTATGFASPPWYVVTNLYTDTTTTLTNYHFYRVEVVP